MVIRRVCRFRFLALIAGLAVVAASCSTGGLGDHEAIEATELSPTEIAEAWELLAHAAEHADKIYSNLPDDLRRVSNQFWFKALEVDYGEVRGHTWGEFGDLVTDDALPIALEREHTEFFSRQTPETGSQIEQPTRELSLVGHGSNISTLVEVAGIEPASFNASMSLLRAQPTKDCRGSAWRRRRTDPLADEKSPAAYQHHFRASPTS